MPAGSLTRGTGHGRAETRTLKAAHVSGLDFPRARQAIKICRWRKDTATGTASRETTYAITSLTSADATAQDLARLVRDHWVIDLAIGILKPAGHASIAAACRYHARDATRVLNTLGIPLA
jgi:hypothetical protein